MNNAEKSYLYEIIDTILQVAQGDYHVQAQLHNENDDLDALAMGINLMIDDIREGVESVEKGSEYLKNIMASIIDILIIVNPDLTIRSINAVGLEELGYTLEELDESNLSILFNNESVFSEDEYQQIIAQGSVKNLEKNIRLKNGEIRPTLFSVSVMNDKEGNVSAFICTARDITDQKIAEKKLKEHTVELEKINKELDQFAYIASHDLKAPLRAIANLSEWIEEDLGSDLPEGVKEHTKLLRSRVGRMQSLIDGILSYSRVSRTEVKYETIDTDKLIEEVLNIIAVPASFEIVKEAVFPLINADRVRMEQVFTNLISNVVKYHDKESGKITLGHKKLENVHEFSVADDGPGIPPEYHEKIFVIFQTLEARDKIESTGVGLSIVKKIIEENGGTIKVESVPGEGTKFIFTWPE
jgi:PAS domain S-box-containing protein